MPPFEIRALTKRDCPAVRLKAETLAAIMYPEMTSDLGLVAKLLDDFVTSDRHYARVLGAPGEPRAALLAAAGPNVWATKKRAGAVLWYSEIPGAGAALLRDFRRWLDGQKKWILVGGFSCDWVLADERPLVLAERIGFVRRGTGGYFYFPRTAAAPAEPLPSKQAAFERLKATMETEQ
jgi:hypothetical protein